MAPKSRSYGTVEEEQANLELALQAIEKTCTDDSKFNTIAAIAAALKNGDKLVGTPLTSCTNYAYKINLQAQPDVALFCKVCNPYANWDPTLFPYDLARADCELEALERCLEIMGEDAPVPTPFFCLDVGKDARMLVCEYVADVEPWHYQFGIGKVDQRVIPKAARAIALLNAAEVDPSFNDSVRQTIRNTLHIGKTIMESKASSTSDSADKAILYFREVGVERCSSIMTAMDEHLCHREVLVHNDFCLMNVLVECKPNSSEFGPNGNVTICDMETAMSGPIGKDAGTWQAFPIAFAFHHAALGSKEEAYHMLDCCIKFFDHYAKTTVEECGKDQEFLEKVFRASLGWISMYTLFAMYLFDMSDDSYPIKGLTDEIRAKAKASGGYTGARFAEIGFLQENPHLTLDELRALFKTIVIDEIEELLAYSESNDSIEQVRSG